MPGPTREVVVHVKVEGLDAVRELVELTRELQAAGITTDQMPEAVVTASKLAPDRGVTVTIDGRTVPLSEYLGR